MSHRRPRVRILATALLPLLASPLLAAKPECGDNKCNGGETVTSCPEDCGGGGGANGSLPACDTFRDDPGDRVTSDGMGVIAGNGAPGEYCDAESKVSVTIGQAHGGHHLDTGKSSREIDLDFSQCAAPPCTQLQGFSGSTSAKLSLANGAKPDGIHLIDEMAVGEQAFVGLVIGFDNGRKNHVRLSFGRDTTVVACPDSGDRVRVIREAADTWTLESDPTHRACLSEVQNNDWDNPVAHGYFHMPFWLRVKLVP